MKYKTVLENILEGGSSNYDEVITESTLADPHIQLFILLADHPGTAFTLDEIVALLKTSGINFHKLGHKYQIQALFSLLYAYDLVKYDFKSKTFIFNPSARAWSLKNIINLIRAL